jgi:thiosulfate dehydrogenase (quinone) large subunit
MSPAKQANTEMRNAADKTAKINQEQMLQSVATIQKEKTMNAVLNRRKQVIQDPPIAKFLFSDPRASILWLIVRVYVGWQWIEAGMGKVTNPAWVQTGDAVKGYWTNAVAIPEVGRPAITFDWYRSFLQFLLGAEAHTWMAPMIAWGELLIGIALVLGVFTGISAFLGASLNFNFMLAGTASTNPVLFFLSIGIMLAWKVAGYIGLDYFLLNMLGTPWRAKSVAVEAESPEYGEAAKA